MPDKADHGLTVVQGQGMTRIRIGCEHQQGLVYVIPAAKSWVCSSELLPGHAISGFLGELVSKKNKEVEQLMESWGIYFRKLPLEGEPEGN